MTYVELQVTSNFSFLKGASHPEELVMQAAALGYKAIAITDVNTLAGVVRAYAAAKKMDVRLIVGCRLDMQDCLSLLIYPVNKLGYMQLTNLLTMGNLRAQKGDCLLYKKDIIDCLIDVKCIAISPNQLNERFELTPNVENELLQLKNHFKDNFYLSATRGYHGQDAKLLYRLNELSQKLDIQLAATNDVYYHSIERRQLQDVVTCIREKCTIYNAGYLLHPNAERYLKPSTEIDRLFRQYPKAVLNAASIAEKCTFSLSELVYEYPAEISPDGVPPVITLSKLAWQGAKDFFGENIPEKISTAINHEMKFIAEMNYAPYFLTVYDIVRYAKEQGILCQGRGSAANSTVCFCLGITSVNPTKFDLLFERFISSARNEPPDIDVDFEHERREEVIQYIYEKYGRDRAAIVATVTQLHHKGALKDVGKAMGLSVDIIGKISGAVWSFSDEVFEAEWLTQQGLNPQDKLLQKTLELTRAFMGFPRQLGQHTGGFVITNGKLSNLVPIMNARMANRTCIEWNKDDIDALGFMKIDVLALGMLTCIRKAFDLAKAHYGLQLTLANIPQDDPAVYDMICKADTLGVFQIESRAQQSMLPRLKPRCFYDLVIEVAIVRPGPIQGDMVHPYLRRRNGEEPVVYPSKELEEILGRTLGVPLFQEQAMKIAIVAAGFTAAEADELRRSMATFKVKGLVTKFEEKLIRGMLERGYPLEYAQRVFRQLEGFGSYGFPESHAASFALLVYVSSWLKCFYPDVFCCALLNSMPMGFYQPAQLIADAKNHGVTILPADVNLSQWDHQLETKAGKYHALRLGFRLIAGLRQQDVNILIQHRNVHYTHINQLRDVGVPQAALEKLADADAFQSMNLQRREALWELSTKDKPIQLFAGQPAPDGVHEQVVLPQMKLSEQVVHDYSATSLSLKGHPVAFVREKLLQLHILQTQNLASKKNGDPVKVCGLILVRQRPGTAKGVCFITIEDETGFANLVIFQNIFDTYRKEILQSKLIMVEGHVQIEGTVVHVIVDKCFNFSKLLRSLTAPDADSPNLLTLARGDETAAPPISTSQKTATPKANIFAHERNFK